MLYIKRNVVVIALCVLSAACSTIDDYMLGKDNTPKPDALPPVKSRVSMVEKWTAPVGRSKKNDNPKLKPVIVGNIIYSADGAGNVQAINKSTGAPVWSKKLSSDPVSGPTVASGHVIVATDDSSLTALKQSDGSELWKAKVSSEVLANPVISNGRVIAKSIDGNLYALDLKNGAKLWVSDHGAPNLILKASSSPVVLGNMILVGYSDGKMDAVEQETGRVLWQRSIAYATGSSDVERLVDIDADPIVINNVALLGSYQGYLGALSLQDGHFLWRKPASIYKNMTVVGNNLYVTDTDDVIWSINRKNGQVNWKQMALKARGLTEPVLMGNRLFVGDKTGLLHVLSASSGEFLARVPMGGPVNVAPVVSDHNLYVMTANGKLSRYLVS
ncbi:outer membrane protein assembly factor BamB [Legionella spiritensis]|uniref:outer membrane protein assembly factor BamB n=1 Tax=Legionella spiritensis TaxID=452 RepID=UPI000F6BDBC9|nr:PQQ (pyrrolo quinoline) WD40-like repeat, enzyme repeat domain protein [Legionella spiritensis]